MIEKQPGSINCFVCGRTNPIGLMLDFYLIAPGQTRVEFSLSSDYEGYPGIVHGGVIAAILDETGGRAQMDHPDRFMVTAQLNVRYRQSVPIETPLIALGFADGRQGRVAKAHSQIVNHVEEVLAEAELVLVDIPECQLANVDPEALGWRVYDDEM
jgi:acyl-coenzyme A thioesterase PaaI-like protein